ncbi:MAG: selenide, water dikinase SelD [Planctomycetota bacterium]
MQARLAKQNLVLWGVGHTNAHILRMWRMQPLPDTQLICLSNYPVATYSGMFPGVLAGQYRVDEMEIDLVRLTAGGSTRLVLDEVTGIDRRQRQLHFAKRPPLDYDLLSIGIGSQPSFDGVTVDDPAGLITVKPMQTFLQRLKSRLQDIASTHRECRVLIVGGGAGSLEIGWCLRSAWNRRSSAQSSPLAEVLFGLEKLEITLVTGAAEIGSGLKSSTVKKAVEACRRFDVGLIRGERVARVDRTGCLASSGRSLSADVVIWATTARGPAVFSDLDLERDQRGFLATRSTLQTVSDDAIFAVGDSGTLVDSPTDKAGVYAVRQGPVLWENLQRSLRGESLQVYRPQRDFLKLLNLGDGRAIAEYRGWSLEGPSWWRMKNRIDTRFMTMYQDYRPPQMPADSVLNEERPRCLGCGGKIGATLLAETLKELPRHDSGKVVVGLAEPDDAAIVKVPSGQATLTTDFFVAPVDDPFLAGRIAALNALSDLYVMGARPTVALANIQIPLGHPRGQQRLLREVMLGASEEFVRAGVELAGGHTIEGLQLALGFTILGEQLAPPLKKNGLAPGAALVLTKPLGTGALLAANMQGDLKGAEFLRLEQHLLVSNEVMLEVVAKFQPQAMTDVTGFGLAGHLIEMLEASHCGAEIELETLPLLDGFAAAVSAGHLSTLAPDNEAFASRVDSSGALLSDLKKAALYDPQTCGGVLLGVDQEKVQPLLAYLASRNFPQAAKIGQVLPSENRRPFIRWK